MHEYSLAQALLHQVNEISTEYSAQVKKVKLQIGEFSGVEAELLQLALKQLTQESMLEECEFEIQRVSLTIVCKSCGIEQPVEKFHFQCKQCGSQDVEIKGGEELMLESIVFRVNTEETNRRIKESK